MRKRILYILHAYFNRGGVELHTSDLRRAIANDYDVYLLFPQGEELFLLSPDERITRMRGAKIPWPIAPADDANINRSFHAVVGELKPDIIHVQHFHQWPTGILDWVKATGAATVISFHDYTALSPIFTLHGSNSIAHGLSHEYNLQFFKQDIHQQVEVRRSEIGSALKGFSAYVVPSTFLASALAPYLSCDFKVIEHGIEPFVREQALPTQNIRFGFVGSLLPQKGWRILVQAFQQVLKERNDVELHLIGGGERAASNIPQIIVDGVYERENLPKVCSSIDVGVIPSIFPETYSYVLSELWMAGLPVIVSDIGTLGDRVIDGINGKKARAGDPASLKLALEWYLNHDEWRNWQLPRPRILSDMVADYKKLYEDLSPK